MKQDLITALKLRHCALKFSGILTYIGYNFHVLKFQQTKLAQIKCSYHIVKLHDQTTMRYWVTLKMCLLH